MHAPDRPYAAGLRATLPWSSLFAAQAPLVATGQGVMLASGPERLEIMKLLSIAQMILSAFAKPKQHVVIQELPTGRVLDIGGGGEGVIAQAGGARVVAIDRRVSEIHEARGKAAHATWVVADATRLPCKSSGLDSATAFFSCMYMSDDVKRKAFREAGRALKKGGEFWIWDAQMVPRGAMFAIRLRVDVRDRPTTNTTYGVRAKEQSAAGIAALLREAGFESEVIVNQRHWFMIKAKRSSCGDGSEDARA
jgi:ubiquinone/menaquinone biosynthesis C-methylase UbiE